MRFNTKGTNNDYGVTLDKIVLYSTTLTTCQCPSHRFSGSQDCKHIKSVNIQCSCPESVWYVHENMGLVKMCAEAFCETSALRRKALENEGWVKVLEELLPRTLCSVCDVELRLLESSIRPNLSLLYCYDGEHRMGKGSSE